LVEGVDKIVAPRVESFDEDGGQVASGFKGFPGWWDGLVLAGLIEPSCSFWPCLEDEYVAAMEELVLCPPGLAAVSRA
jgi:hypothetical protein